MISMIVCSVDPAKLEKFCENVLMTVGCPCEFVVHDNRETGYGITHVYNLCAAKAKGEYLCFAHEDIFFRTPDWGERIVSLLQRPATGVVGFAGSTAKLAAYSGWGSMKQYTRYNYIQRFRNGSIKYCIANPDKVSASPVIVLDGMCLFMRKEVWAETRFDEATFQGFHLYDLDISMAVGQKYVNYVTNDVLLEHFSEGSYNQAWLDDTAKFHKKWADRLPFLSREAQLSGVVFQGDKDVVSLYQNAHEEAGGQLGFYRVVLPRTRSALLLAHHVAQTVAATL